MAWTQVANIRGPTGATGSTGPQGPTGTPGLGFTWRGPWSNTTAYAINDCVERNLQSYVCVVANTGNDPAVDNTNWNLLVASAISHCPSTAPPAIGSTVTVTWTDDISWQTVGLPVACGDLASGQLAGIFVVTAVSPATRTSTLQRTS